MIILVVVLSALPQSLFCEVKKPAAELNRGALLSTDVLEKGVAINGETERSCVVGSKTGKCNAAAWAVLALLSRIRG